MLLLIENGEIYDPEPRGEASLLTANEKIEIIGDVDHRALDKLGAEYEAIDATGCYVIPGLIDPHAHLLGGSGEGSLALATPMVFVEEIAGWGTTTVVGLLGVDTTMKTIEGLLARVKALDELGLSTRMWSGGYNVPPTTLLGSVRQDMMFVQEVIGAGEIAVSDERGLNQSSQELAKLVRDTHVGGLLTGKSGVTHFHVGEENVRLQPLRDLVNDYQVKCEWLFPTHVQRNAKLLDEAIELAINGACINFDVVEKDFAKWLRYYIDHAGPLDKLSVCSDMDSCTPQVFYTQFCEAVVKHGFALDLVLPLFTSNTAYVLKLKTKGCLKPGNDADLLVVTKDGMDIRYVVANGKVLVRDGDVQVREKWLEKSMRDVQFIGDENPDLKKMLGKP